MFITAYAAPAASPVAAGGQYASILMLVVMFALLYFVLIRPQKKKEKELKNMIAALKVGDEIATIGGIHGKIVRVKDDLFLIETGMGTSKSFMSVDRSAVSRFIKQAEENKNVTPIPEAEEKKEEK